MYNYRQHDLSEATARALENADAGIDALEEAISSCHYYDLEWDYLWDALHEAWEVFKWTPLIKGSAIKGAFLLNKHFNTLNH